MPARIITFYDITGVNTSAAETDQIRYFNAGGAIGTALMPSPLDCGPTEAGFWSQPQVFLIESNGGTIKSIGLRLWDTGGNTSDPQNQIVTSLGEDVMPDPTNHADPTNWFFKMTLKQNWVDPTTIGIDPTSTEITGWTDVPWASDSSASLDSMLQTLGNGNTGTTDLMVAHASNGKFYSNFYVYVSVMPTLTAIAGTHDYWGYRLSYIYPGNAAA